eukprot:Gb_39792 [translate_table: standard]
MQVHQISLLLTMDSQYREWVRYIDVAREKQRMLKSPKIGSMQSKY